MHGFNFKREVFSHKLWVGQIVTRSQFLNVGRELSKKMVHLLGVLAFVVSAIKKRKIINAFVDNNFDSFTTASFLFALLCYNKSLSNLKLRGLVAKLF